MTIEQSLSTETYPAGEDLSSYQYHAVALSSGSVVRASAGLTALGILQNAPDTAGQPCSVAVRGKSKAVAGTAGFTSDAAVTPGTNGVIDDLATGDIPIGKATETVAAGLIGTIHINSQIATGS